MSAHFATPRPHAGRLGVALVVSVVAHALLCALLAPGTSGRRSPREGLPPSTALHARIVLPAPPRLPLAEADPGPDAVPSPPPVPPPPERKALRPPVAAAVPEAAPRAGPREIPDLTYYAARELDVFPALTAALDLRADAVEGAGRVRLVLLIDAEGRVQEATVVEAEPAGRFDEDATRALRAARFTPALRGGRAVRSRVLVEISYGAQGAR